MWVLAMIMAGGEGKRLFPLTAERAKPAVPFAGKYRIIGFAEKARHPQAIPGQPTMEAAA